MAGPPNQLVRGCPPVMTLASRCPLLVPAPPSYSVLPTQLGPQQPGKLKREPLGRSPSLNNSRELSRHEPSV